MMFIYYARRCKRKTGDDCYATVHAAGFYATSCGIPLDEMMWITERETDDPPLTVTCRKCKAAMRQKQ